MNNKSKNLKNNFLKVLFNIQIGNKLVIVFLVIIFIRLVLTTSQDLIAITYAGHDDRLFLILAENIINGHWLGEYNNLTLIKGAFYPLFIAASYFAGIPLLLSQQLLYVFASVIFVISVRPLVKSPIFLTLLFCFVIFNPISYASPISNRVIREGIYISLTLLVISSTVGLYLRRSTPLKNLFHWSALLGISLSALWFTREEGIWITPLLLLVFVPLITTLLQIRRHTLNKTILNILLLTFPFFFLLLNSSILSFINLHYYKTFTTIELKNHPFVQAYGALSRVKHSVWQEQVPLPKSTRLEIYKVSETFSEIEPFLEGGIEKRWIEASNSDEIKGGWFVWAFRDAVSSAGYYEDGRKAENYYTELANEINSLCDEKKLNCLEERNSMSPPFRTEYIKPLFDALIESGEIVLRFGKLSPGSDATSIGNAELMVLFQKVTLENIVPIEEVPESNDNNPIITMKTSILETITGLYSYLVPISLILCLINMIILIVNKYDKKYWKDIILITFLLIAILILRLGIISYIHVSSFGAINYYYLSPIFIVIICIIAINFAVIFSYIEKYYKQNLQNSNDKNNK